MRPQILAVLATALVLAPAQALACGACVSRPGPPAASNPAYVAQKAERVLFVRDAATKKSQVWVEIRYNGQPEDFGWVVPMPKKPVVGVGTGYLFDRLDQATAPRMQLTFDATRENCVAPAPPSSFGFGGCADNALVTAGRGSATGTPTHSNVQVLESATIGPYNYAILASKDSKDLLDWLNKNGFTTPAKAQPIIDAHLAKGDVFVAFKLLNNKGIDAIVPVTFTMDDAEPCVPLRLTSVAAVEDMQVIVYLAGPGRGIPKNHLHVQVNPFKLAWEKAGDNYGQVLAAAIDEAAGRAFATEFAGPTKSLAVAPIPKTLSQISLQFGRPLDGDVSNTGAYGSGQLVDVARLDTTPFQVAHTPQAVAEKLKLTQFPLSDDVIVILNRYLPTKTGVIGFSWRNIQLAGSLSLSDAASLANPATVVDGPALAAELGVIGKSLLDIVPAITNQPTLTRLALRISPDEMTRDPIFAFHSNLPPVTNITAATVRNVCLNGDDTDNATRLTIGDSKVSHIIRNGHAGLSNFGTTTTATVHTALDPRFVAMPAASVIEVLDEAQPPIAVAASQIALVDTAIAGALPGQPTLPKDLVLKPATQRLVIPPRDPPANLQQVQEGAQVNPGGCSARTAHAMTALILLVMAALAVVVRRRAQ